MKKLGDRRRRRTGDRVTDDTDRPGTADRPVLIHLNILIFLISLILIIFIFLVAVLRRTRLLRNGCHTFTLVSRLPDLADDFQILFRLTRPLLSQQRSDVLHGIGHPRHLRPDSSHLCTRLLRLSQLVDQWRHTLADNFDEHLWPFSDHKHLPIHFPSRVLLRRLRRSRTFLLPVDQRTPQLGVLTLFAPDQTILPFLACPVPLGTLIARYLVQIPLQTQRLIHQIVSNRKEILTDEPEPPAVGSLSNTTAFRFTRIAA